MDEKGKMSARNREAQAAAFQADGPTADPDAGRAVDGDAHPTWLDRVREAAAPEPAEPLWNPEPVGSPDSLWEAADTVEPAPPVGPQMEAMQPETVEPEPVPPSPQSPGAIPGCAG